MRAQGRARLALARNASGGQPDEEGSSVASLFRSDAEDSAAGTTSDPEDRILMNGDDGLRMNRRSKVIGREIYACFKCKSRYHLAKWCPERWCGRALSRRRTLESAQGTI